MKKLFYISLIFLGCGCTFHRGNFIPTQQLSHYKVVDQAVGTASAFYLFNIGGNKKDALVYEAKQSLMKSTKLKPGQYLTNHTVDFRTFVFVPVITNRVFITADIIELVADETTLAVAEKNRNYNYGDTMYINGKEKVKIINLDDGQADVLRIDDQDLKVKRIFVGKLTNKAGSTIKLDDKKANRKNNLAKRGELDIDDMVKVKINGKEYQAKILKFNDNDLVVEVENDGNKVMQSIYYDQVFEKIN